MPEPSSPTSLYRYYDAHRVLIYAGITKRGALRNAEHNASRPWWRYVASQEVEHFPTRELAHAREVELIERYTPPFNVQHNRHHQQMREAYLAVHAATLPASSLDPVKQLQALDRRLPLVLLERELSQYGNLWLSFRTEPAHASIARLLEHVTEARARSEKGAPIGVVKGVECRGPFAVIRVESRLASDCDHAVAKLRVVLRKGPPIMHLRHVKLLDGSNSEAAAKRAELLAAEQNRSA